MDIVVCKNHYPEKLAKYCLGGLQKRVFLENFQKKFKKL